MTLRIELPDEDVTALEAKANAQSLSAENCAQQVLLPDLRQQTRETISSRFRQL